MTDRESPSPTREQNAREVVKLTVGLGATFAIIAAATSIDSNPVFYGLRVVNAVVFVIAAGVWLEAARPRRRLTRDRTGSDAE